MALITTPVHNQSINKCHNKCCCGPVRYLLDECDSAEPWKCYWKIRNFNLIGQVVDKDKSGWSMSGGRMKPGLYTNASSLTEQERFMFKLKSYPPPWTIDVAIQFSDITSLPGIGTNFLLWVLNNRFRWEGATGNSWVLRTASLGAGSNMQTASGTFVAAGNSLTMKVTCDTSRLVTLSGTLDGAVPTIVSGPAIPQSFTISESTLNSLTNLDYWPVTVAIRGEGYIDYIEASVEDSI